jgi:hypothetical protein
MPHNERKIMSVLPDYMPRFTPPGFLFWSHIGKNDRSIVTKRLNVPESAVLILPYDTPADGVKNGKFSAFVSVEYKSRLDDFNKELDALKDACYGTLFNSRQSFDERFFTIPLLTKSALTGRFTIDCGTKERAKMTKGDKVVTTVAEKRVTGEFLAEFWNPREALYYSTVLLDHPRLIIDNKTGIGEEMWLVNVPSRLVSKREPGGVILSFPTVTWRYAGEVHIYSVAMNKARALAAMAHVDKIQAIKYFRMDYGTDVAPCPLKAAKDVIEALMVRFPKA